MPDRTKPKQALMKIQKLDRGFQDGAEEYQIRYPSVCFCDDRIYSSWGIENTEDGAGETALQPEDLCASLGPARWKEITDFRKVSSHILH